MWMRYSDIFSMAVRNLFKRKLRTMLTILGVVIGTSAIVVMISLGLAMNKTFNEELEKLGDITIIRVYRPYQNDGQPKSKQLLLDDNAVAKFKGMKGVVVATPLVQANLYAKSGKYIASWLQIVGIDPEAMEPLGYTVSEGRVLEKGDKLNAVYGAEVGNQFYKQNDNNWWRNQNQGGGPVVDVMKDRIQFSYDWAFVYGQESMPGVEKREIKPYNIKAVGLLEAKGYQTDYSIFMNITEVQKLLNAQKKFEQDQRSEWGGSRPMEKTEGYETVLVKCTDLDTVKKVNEIIRELGYPTEIPSEYLDTMQQMAGSLQALLGAIGAVSLFVAAIGIANTMIMSIYERTSEIGVMKVIGALLSDIRSLFLLEAAMIGFIGGILGLLLSLLISYILNTSGVSFMGTINQYMPQSTTSLITPWLCGLALLFSTLMGLVSGYYPARRAMRLNALAAIRTE